MIKLYDRKLKKYYIEKEYGSSMLDFLYNNMLGRIILKTFVITKFYSNLNAKKEKSKKSIEKIPSFIKEYNIDMSRFEKKDYSSFDDFFTRKMKKEMINIDLDNKALIAPADSKMQVYRINKDMKLSIKGADYTLEELLRDNKIAKEYRNGLCLVYRLSVDDYHRYCHIDKGRVLTKKIIQGKLHTVRPIASKYKVFKENQREYSELDTDNLGKIIYMEVGALQIGKINNHSMDRFEKGEEKGYFSYGGSTIVVLIKENRVEIDEDILKVNSENIEVKVSYGERIGNIL